jgi:monofunctional biosynthetic peptidoglycan transglycosylase
MARVLRRLALAGAATGAAAVAWLFFVWPPPSWWRTHWPAETAFMRMRGRQLAAARDTTARRYRPLPLDSIGDWLERAAVAGEDDAFFSHHGIDYRALRSALGYTRDGFAWTSARDRAELRRALARAWQRRDRLRGASTITQQLAKNLYLSPSRNPLRKVKEAAIAFRLEWALPKERILALYLNVAEFGPNLWGVEAAARRYVGRGAARLSLEQAALLVATLPHPLSSNPAYRPGRARWRQQLIVRRLRGEPVELPDDAAEADTVVPPASPPSRPVPDSGVRADSLPPDSLPPPRDSAAAPVPPDTAAATGRSR